MDLSKREIRYLGFKETQLSWLQGFLEKFSPYVVSLDANLLVEDIRGALTIQPIQGSIENVAYDHCPDIFIYKNGDRWVFKENGQIVSILRNPERGILEQKIRKSKILKNAPGYNPREEVESEIRESEIKVDIIKSDLL